MTRVIIKMKYKKSLYFLLLLLSGFGLRAQTWEVGAMGGGAAYIGDLNPVNPVKISGLAAGAYVKANLDPYWAIGLHYNYGRIGGSDAESDNEQLKNRNLSFYTPLNEVSLQVDFNFLEYFAGGGTKRFSPYIFAGIGGVFYTPKATRANQEYKLSFYRTEGQAESYKSYALTVPYGAGLRVRLKDNWGLFSQIGYRTAYTDYLDDVSGKYPAATAWGAEPANITAIRRSLSDPSLDGPAMPGSQRGDFRKRDTYMFVGIGISYTFISSKCYTF